MSASKWVIGVIVNLVWMIPFFAMVITVAALQTFEAGQNLEQPFPEIFY